MKEIEPSPPEDVLENYQWGWKVTLFERLPGIDFHFKHNSFKRRDVVIFRDNLDDGNISYGTLIGNAYDREHDVYWFMVVSPLGSVPGSPNVYPLIPVTDPKVIMPKHKEGERISKPQRVGHSLVSAVVDERYVAIDDDGTPVYRYRLRLEVKGCQGDLTEEELTEMALNQS